MDDKTGKIKNFVIQSNGIGNYLVCTFEDGSLWKCSLEGKNWELYVPSLEELTKLFYEKTKTGI